MQISSSYNYFWREKRSEFMKKYDFNIEKGIFIPTIGIFAAISVLMIIGGEWLYDFLNMVLHVITTRFGWTFLWIYVINFLFLGWLATSEYGKIRLGESDEKPEYSNFSWISMVFTTGIDASIMIMSLFEPIHYLREPPFGIEPFSDKAYDYAHMYGQFHWGPSAWTMYIPATIAIAYTLYIKKADTTRISSSCTEAMGTDKRVKLKGLIDFAVIFGIMGGIGASIGLEIPVIAEIFGKITGANNELWLKLAMLGLLFVLFGSTVYLGLDKGIEKLSIINVYVVLVFLGVMLFFGPTQYIIDSETNSIGLLISDFVKMSLHTDPNALSGFPQKWTIFYWGWWLAYMPVMGLFVARISRGRTIRQVIGGQVLWGSAGCMTFFAIMGGYSLNLQKAGIIPVADILANQGQEAAIAAIIGTLPMPKIMLVVYCLACFIFLATTISSAAYILAALTTKKLTGYEQPARWNRMLWAVIFMLFSAGIMVVGGFETIQVVCVIAGFPLIIVCALLMRSIYIMVKNHPE